MVGYKGYKAIHREKCYKASHLKASCFLFNSDFWFVHRSSESLVLFSCLRGRCSTFSMQKQLSSWMSTRGWLGGKWGLR